MLLSTSTSSWNSVVITVKKARRKTCERNDHETIVGQFLRQSPIHFASGAQPFPGMRQSKAQSILNHFISNMAASGDSSPSIKKLKLVVFGATGRTGREVVKQALEKGHHVTAVVRTPEKLTIQHENLVLVKGDACDVESFAAALDGKDAVLSSLGVYANIFNPTTFYSTSMHAITEAMSRHKITRLVTVTSWCTQPGPNNYWFLEWVIKPLFLNGVIKDMATMEEMLESSDPQALNYTIVRPCRLLEGELTGNYKAEEGQCNTGTTNKITCADVAEFMLKTLESDEYDRKGMAIAGL